MRRERRCDVSLVGTQSPDAACAAPGVDPELFTSNRQAEVAKAKAICATCPLVQACLKDALERGERGVWGGTTAAERLGLKSKRRGPKPQPVKHGTNGGYQAHLKRGEVACKPCKAGAAKYKRSQIKPKRKREMT